MRLHLQKVKNRHSLLAGGFALLILFLLLGNSLANDRVFEYLGTYGRLTSFALSRVEDADTAFRVGNYFFNGDAYNLEKAVISYKRALVLSPSHPFARYQYARAEFLRGNFATALEQAEKQIKVNPDFPNTWYVRGLIHGYVGLRQKAADDFRTFISRVPEQWAGYNDLAWILARQENFAEMKRVVNEAFEKLPHEKERNPWLWTNMGIAEMNLGEYRAAGESFEKALEIAKKMTPKYFWSAYPGNNPRSANDAYRNFLSTLYFNLGLVYEKSGEPAAAVEEYKKALAAYGENPPFNPSLIAEKIKTLEKPPFPL